MFLLMALFIIPNTEAEMALIGGREHIHLNMKEASDLSPETWGDNTREAIKDNPPRSYSSGILDTTRTREWKDVGTWTTTNSNVFDIGLGGPVKFNLWWRETDQGQDDSYDAQVQYRFRLNIDGQEAAYYTDEGENGNSHECAQSKPCEWNGEVGKINISSAPKGTIFDIEIEYWAFSDIEIYYDNVSFNSGVAFGADAIKFGQSGINGRAVSFDFVQAWDTDAKEAVNGDYIRLIIGGVGLNSSLQESGYPIIEDGLDYDLNGTTITSTKVTWYVDDEYAKLDQSVISFSLTRRSCDTAPPIEFNTVDILTKNSGSGDDEGGLPVPGFNFILVIFALLCVTYSKREL